MRVFEIEVDEYLNDLRILKQPDKLDKLLDGRSDKLDVYWMDHEKIIMEPFIWKSFLETGTFEKYLMHYSKEQRLRMLALLVESKKSTLRFYCIELDSILLFLKYNLCEKMEYIPFIKKALKRLKNSLAVMQRELAQELKMRNHCKEQNTVSETYENIWILSETPEQIKQNIKNYTTFFIYLREICVNSLTPDATYNRRHSSLQILLLMEDLQNEFKDIEWEDKQAKRIFECLLLDTYESNKEIAYQILKSMNGTWVHKYLVQDIIEITEVAFELGNSIRPIDSVTAAYMLKMPTLFPLLHSFLGKDIVSFKTLFHSKDNCIHYDSAEQNITDSIRLQLILKLYKKLQEALSLAKQNIGMAIAKCSLYGYLFCIRNLLSDCDFRKIERDPFWQHTINEIIVLCAELNHVVSVVVNNSSPEGYLPMDLKTLNFNDDVLLPEKKTITPQMILLCSWRTVKEVSQLYGLLATKASIQTDECVIASLSKNQIVYMMEHFIFLLCETKHRGAFEQAYVGFHQLCTRLWQLPNSDIRSLLIWCLHNTLTGITGLTGNLCATRRSAGVPFVIQAVLSSGPKAHNLAIYDLKVPTFHSVMKVLLEFLILDNTIYNVLQRIDSIIHNNTVFAKFEHKRQEILERNEFQKIKLDVLKTHSMNILRALFKDSQLGDMVKDYIADGLRNAIKNFNSKTWAERNAATLLFSALIIRIFGVQRTKDHINLTTDNKMTGKIFFERYPILVRFILTELQEFVSIDNDVIKPHIQAILLLLSRLYISKTEIYFDSELQKINNVACLVSKCAKSPVHKTRELAARALVPLLTEKMAENALKKLFLFLCTAQDIRISANLIHGYLLQILEILTKMPCVHVRNKLYYEITHFLSMTNWILKGLERETNGSTCFLIATIYVDILHALYNLDKNSGIEIFNLGNISHILQQHLIKKDLLMSGPGEQMYKVSIIKFMLCIGEHSNFWQTMQNEHSKAFDIYSQLLITPEAEVQSIAWTTVVDMLKKESCQNRKLLSTYAIRTAANSIEDLFKCNPKLQDAIFDFLYHNLMDINGCCIADKREICNLVLKRLYPHDASYIYSQRISYLRLLGKCMVTLNHELKDEELKVECIKDVYKKVCDSDWIGSLHKDFRSSVFDILHDLFNKNDFGAEHCHPMLDWWTMVLQLLVDDNADIRHETSILICRIEPHSKLKCFERILSIFFEKFNKLVADKYPEIAISAFFCWSVSLLGNIDYEMNETDVFNKCRNYDVFEPVKISELCFNLTKSIMQQYSIDSILPSDVVSWINDRLDTNFSELLSFRDIVRRYKDNLPTFSGELNEVLDPTFKDKLLQISACINYVSL